MKKIFLAAIAVACMTGISMAQTDEWTQMFMWLQQYYGGNKEAAYSAMNGISEKIKADFPMDQKLVDAVNAAQAQAAAAQLALAQKYGFSNYNDFYMEQKYHPEKYPNAKQELELIWTNESTTTGNLTKAYNEELNKRIQAAEIEAIKRIQVNAKAMK
jgi:hypothetical protein